MATSFQHIAIVILAAGASSRMGSPKQLLEYDGKTLLQHAIETALATDCPKVVVVLGARADLLKPELANQPIQILENKNWQEGMASSIRYALQHITIAGFQPESVIFMVCDQPYVTSSLLMSLVEKGVETGMPIVASGYGDKAGTPALFHKSIFLQLMELKGDKGARALLAAQPEKVAIVPFPKGVTDIDMVADYELLKRENDC